MGRKPIFESPMTQGQLNRRFRHKRAAARRAEREASPPPSKPPTPLMLERMARRERIAPQDPEFRSGDKVGEEIAQLAAMRACWTYSEDKFERRIRAICYQMPEGDPQAFYDKIVAGNADEVPAELAFATAPLVDMLMALRKGRARVDKAFRLAISPKMHSNRPVVADVPVGYIPEGEASKRIGCSRISSLSNSAVVDLAYSRAVCVPNGKRGNYPLYFCAEDIEAARLIYQEAAGSRVLRPLASVIRAPEEILPPGAVALEIVVARTGITRGTLGDHWRSGNNSDHLPKVFRSKNSLFSYEADIAEFLQRRDAFNALELLGWLDTRGAAERLSISHNLLMKARLLIGVEPARFGHHVRYSPDDIERMRDAIELLRQKRQAAAAIAANIRHQTVEYAKAKRAAARAMFQDRPKAKIFDGAFTGIPRGAIKISEALQKVGLSDRQFRRAREGSTRSPMPPFYITQSGRFYCLPQELDEFMRQRSTAQAERN